MSATKPVNSASPDIVLQKLHREDAIPAFIIDPFACGVLCFHFHFEGRVLLFEGRMILTYGARSTQKTKEPDF